MKELTNVKRCRKMRRPQLINGLAFALAFGCLSWLTDPAQAQQTLSQPGKLPELSIRAPEPQQAFRLESEAQFTERLAREAAEGRTPLGLTYKFALPSYPPVQPQVTWVPRVWEPLAEVVEPAYLCYGRLYFEQINAERYGWDLGPLHPLISAGIFFFDVGTFPYHAATEPLRCYECNPGYALPGDPMPLLLYPPNLNLPGVLAEAAAIGLMFVIFPP
jgi:hypothetical protein